MFRMLRNIGRVLAYCRLPKWLIIEYPLVPRSLRPRLFRHWFSFPEFAPSACLNGEAKGKRFLSIYRHWRVLTLALYGSLWRAQHLLFHDIPGASRSGFPNAYGMCADRWRTEFTKRFTKARLDEDLTLFERTLKEYGNLPKIHSMISSITV